MNKRKKDTRWLASVALMMAVVILLASTPLGMIQLPVVKATTVHIPVILGAFFWGPGRFHPGRSVRYLFYGEQHDGAYLLSFAFSPFMSMTGISGAVKAVWISVGCRILIGFFAGWLWILLSKCKMNRMAALAVTGFMGSMVNTVAVMGSIYKLLALPYAQVKNVAVDAVWGLIMATVTASGIPERS